MLYQLKIYFLKTLWGNTFWKQWQTWRDNYAGNHHCLPKLIQDYAPGNSFVDIGCMWGVNGEYAFIAEEAGATMVKGVDVFGPTPKFEEKKRRRKSSVEFILGDVSHPDTLTYIGAMDVVFCAGVLYHHPSPFDLLVALRHICNKFLILRTFIIPEISGLPNAAVYYPMLDAKNRQLWNLKSLGILPQLGITEKFDPKEGYGNWFWGLTPSCLVSLLKTAGFQVERQFTETFIQTLVCKPIDVPFVHRLPNERDVPRLGE